MAYKNFYTNFENQVFFEKKILSQYVYGKHFVRNNVLSNIKQVDNYTSLTNILIKNPLPIGFSFYTNRFLFKHNLNKNFKINSFLNFSNSYTSTLSLKLYNIFQILQKKNRTKFRKQMFFLNPIKGGFVAFSIGAKGFIPQSHTPFLFKRLLKGRLNQSSDLVLATSSFLVAKEHIIKKYLSFKVPFYKIKVTLFPSYNLQFSKVSARKKWFLKNCLNFVFLGTNVNVIKPKKTKFSINRKKKYLLSRSNKI
jgi:hypothetical protein